MVVCSCNEVTTDKIKECIERDKNITIQQILKEIGWKADCAVCTSQMVQHIKEIMGEAK